MGDAFLAWATVVRPWNQPAPPLPAASPYAGWRWVWMLLWGTILVLSTTRLVMLLRSGKMKPA